MTVQADAEIFPQAQCDALFAAVLVHDDLYPDAVLPDRIHFDYQPEQFVRCYRLCRQLFLTGLDRTRFRHLVTRIRRDRALDVNDREAFRLIRANYKHMHFACITLDRRHRYPRWLHLVTAIMGNVQDALKYGTGAETGRWARLLTLFLSRPITAAADREINAFQPTTPAAFRAHVLAQIDRIRTRIALPQVTGSEFHEIRKVISRQVALYDNLKTLYPSDYHEAISRYLSTINGLMGRYHDGLVERKIQGTQDYHRDRFVLPQEMRTRLEALVGRYA